MVFTYGQRIEFTKMMLVAGFELHVGITYFIISGISLMLIVITEVTTQCLSTIVRQCAKHSFMLF